MRLFPRLLLTNLLVTLLALVSMFLAAEALAPGFYGGHVEQMARMMSGMAGGMGGDLRDDLVNGLRSTLTRAMLTAVPLAAGVALLSAWWVSRRLGRSVQALDEGSRALAEGHYALRLPETGHDELTDLAHNFNVMAGQLQQVEQGRVELIGNVAHELRAPLTALRGYADALSDQLIQPEHAAVSIAREVAAMERLVRDLSLVSRVEAGRVELNLGEVSPARVLDAVRERYAALFDEHGVRLVLPDDGPWPAVRADEERVAQVLSNLLSNALRHSRAGGSVRIGVVADESLVRFSVTDDGTGIAPEHLPRIFERFYRADPARSRREGGSGVGLTIARGLVESMGGQISAASVVGEGAQFAFTLPRWT